MTIEEVIKKINEYIAIESKDNITWIAYSQKSVKITYGSDQNPEDLGKPLDYYINMIERQVIPEKDIFKLSVGKDTGVMVEYTIAGEHKNND